MWRHVGATLLHKFWVARFMIAFAFRLIWRAIIHDFSKFKKDEADHFARVLPRLAGTTYGSDEYKSLLREIKPAISVHYRKNTHHPEHFQDGVNGMSLIDIVEMFCDWRAAVKRHNDGDILTSISHNQGRFYYSDDLRDILKNEVI